MTALSPAVAAIAFDLKNPPEARRALGTPLKLAGGAPSALLCWWEALVDESLPCLSTCPWPLGATDAAEAPPTAEGSGVERAAPYEREHWLTPAFLLAPRETTSPSEEAEEAVVVASHDELELVLELRRGRGLATGKLSPAAAPASLAPCSCGVHALWGAERICEINTFDWAAAAAAKLALASFRTEPRPTQEGGTHIASGLGSSAAPATSPLAVLDVSDDPVWSLLLAREGCAVACVEQSAAAAAVSERFVRASGAARKGLHVGGVSVQVIDMQEEEEGGESGEDAGEGERGVAGCEAPRSGPLPALLLVAPFFSHLRRQWGGSHLAEMGRRRRLAERRGLVGPETPQLPCAVRLRAVLLSCPRLHARHAPVGTSCGVDVSCFNTLGEAPRYRSLPLWQWDHTPLGEPFTVAVHALPLATNEGGEAVEWLCPATAKLPPLLGPPQTCHAVCAWLDFSFGGEPAGDAPWLLGTGPVSPSAAAATAGVGALRGPTPWSQGVFFFSSPVELLRGDRPQLTLRLGLSGDTAGSLVARLDVVSAAGSGGAGSAVEEAKKRERGSEGEGASSAPGRSASRRKESAAPRP